MINGIIFRRLATAFNNKSAVEIARPSRISHFNGKEVVAFLKCLIEARRRDFQGAPATCYVMAEHRLSVKVERCTVIAEELQYDTGNFSSFPFEMTAQENSVRIPKDIESPFSDFCLILPRAKPALRTLPS